MEKKILIIEDDQDMLELLRTSFIREGFNVIGFANGQDALESMKSKSPDLVTLDLLLVGMDGMMVLKKMREQGLQVPVIILTNLSANEEIMKGIVRDEPAYYLIKSDSPIQKIIEKVKSALESKKIYGGS